MSSDTRLGLPVVIVYVVETVSAFSRDATSVIFSSASIASLYPLAAPELGHGHLPAAAAARPDVLLEDPRLLLPVVICVNRPTQTLTGADVLGAYVDFEGKDAACLQSTSKVPSPRSRRIRPL